MADTEPTLGARLRLILGFIALLWAIEVVNQLTGHALDRFGIWPRHLSGLIGIPLAPLLHGGILHLVSNTLPLLVLGFLVAVHGMRAFFAVTIAIVLIGGAGVWLMARSNYHIGASGLIFGYFGYLVAMGWYARSVKAVLIAIGVVLFYGGMIFGVLPRHPYISWESHLFGLLAGIWVARFIHKRPERALDEA